MTDQGQDRPALRRGPDPEEEALEWLVRLTSGDVGADERARFARWHAEPGHAAAYDEARLLWEGIGQVFSAPDNVVVLRPPVRSIRSWGRQAAAIAACVAVFGLAGQQYIRFWQYDATTRGSARGTETLADGSRIELNTGSALDVAYSGRDRRVTLARGEAFFNVKRDPARPFIIKAGSGEVRVLGTAFSVERSGEGARVTVIRGKVRVEAAGKYVDLVPNQQVRFDGGPPQAVRGVDAGKLLAWSEGRLVFEKRPLGEVVAAIDRYYPGMIILDNEKAAKKSVDAVVHLDRIDEWLGSLEKSQDVTLRRGAGIVYIS
ncbi:FecR family protein [Sphingopyxis sp. YR583]|uniref:FecR family protein n=1 Tax=Sphingopyxis sp. YR583 TaxID=1881047 RepID=UPI0015A57356|nr:FecR family protein [Sphingopyxis sp. YR583]